MLGADHQDHLKEWMGKALALSSWKLELPSTEIGKALVGFWCGFEARSRVWRKVARGGVDVAYISPYLGLGMRGNTAFINDIDRANVM